MPNESQLKYLRSISNRCLAEEEYNLHDGKDSQEKFNTEPLREGLLGPPGTGKSECLKWTRRFFTECMGWEHGVQFQFCAPQHTMAAVIGGTSSHVIHWLSVESRTVSINHIQLELAPKGGMSRACEPSRNSQIAMTAIS